MAIATYTDLKQRVADFMARSDLTELIPDFIALAEGRLSRSVRALEMQANDPALAISSGKSTLPADYQEWLSVRWTGATRSQDLAFVEPDSPEWRFRYRPNGDPQMFTIMSGSIHTRPAADDADTLSFDYYKTLTSEALSDVNTTNWLLTKSPDMYIYTSLAEYNFFMKDDQRATQFLIQAKGEGDKESIATDTSKFMTNPARPVDTGNQGSRTAGAGGLIG